MWCFLHAVLKKSYVCSLSFSASAPGGIIIRDKEHKEWLSAERSAEWRREEQSEGKKKDGGEEVKKEEKGN